MPGALRVPETEYLGGVPLARSTTEAAAQVVNNWAAAGERGHVHLVNAYTISLAYRDPVYNGVISDARVNFPDGRPLTWISRLQRGRLRQVRGMELFKHSLATSTEEVRHFLLGGTPETLALLEQRIGERFPRARICGTYSPPFRTLSSAELVHQRTLLQGAEANLVWVGLGTPKQDHVAQELANEGYLAVAVGAAFDFLAGTKAEAPELISRMGLEWLFRLVQEPRRLWRRYLVGNLLFLRAVIRPTTRA